MCASGTWQMIALTVTADARPRGMRPGGRGDVGAVPLAAQQGAAKPSRGATPAGASTTGGGGGRGRDHYGRGRQTGGPMRRARPLLGHRPR